MPYKATLIAGTSEERRHYLSSQEIDRMKTEDTVIIPIGYWEIFDSLSYREGIDWLLESYRYLEAPINTLIVIDDIVPLFDTPKGYLVPLLLELYKEKGVSFIMGTSRVSSEYTSPHIRSLCSTIISTRVYSEMQSKLLFGRKGAESLEDNEYLMKRNGKITKGTLSECLLS